MEEKTDSWTLYKDNESVHNTLSVRQFFAKRLFPILEHPPYSPDLAPCDFCLFPRVKRALKETHFQSVEEVKVKTADLLKRVISEELLNCFVIVIL